MKNIRTYGLILTLASLFSIFSLSGVALADPAQLLSGPTGTIVNGWYTAHPTVQIQAVCSGAGWGNIDTVDIAGWSWSGSGPTPEQALPGNHYVEVLSNNNSVIYLENDGSTFEDGAGGCSTAYPDNGVMTVLWQGYIKWDTTSPTISITSPSNNTNLSSSDSTTTVSGNVSDTGSGIQSVTVNGVNASVSGSSFTASININYGLNTISAVAKSNSGATTTSQSISVFRYESASSGSGTNGATSQSTPTKSTGNNSNPSPTASSGNTNNTSSPNATSNKPPTTSNQVSTPVKVAGSGAAVGAASLGVASYLGYVPYKKIGLFLAKFIAK